MPQSFVLPRALYQQTLWFIRRYPDFKEQYADSIRLGGMVMGQPRGTTPSSTVEQAALRRLTISVQIDVVDRALAKVPEGYRQGIMDYIINRKRYPDYEALNTWKMWKQRFVYWTAEELGWF